MGKSTFYGPERREREDFEVQIQERPKVEFGRETHRKENDPHSSRNSIPPNLTQENPRKKALPSLCLPNSLFSQKIDSSLFLKEKECIPEEKRSKYPNLNFNLSHHGSWVVCASDPCFIIGCDVMKIELPHYQPTEESFFESMSSCFTQQEWQNIKHSPIGSLRSFYVHWTLKESYIKAVAIGLGLDLLSFEFKGVNYQEGGVSVWRGGRKREDWAFNTFDLDENHVMSLAVGPIEDAIDSFKEVLPKFSQNTEIPSQKHISSFKPKILEIRDLLP